MAANSVAQTTQLIQATFALMQTLQQMQQGQNENRNVAANYIRDSGAFLVKPLEKGVEVKPPDDSGYWAALGYEA